MAIGFWTLDHPARVAAVISETGHPLTYGELREGSDRFSECLSIPPEKTLGFLLCRNTPQCLMAYLGALRSGQAVCLLDAELQPELLKQMLELYLPDWVFAPEETGIPGYVEHKTPNGFLYQSKIAHPETRIAPELALLLPTSGSTGSPKLVRLTLQNLQANAISIVSYLGITAEDRALTSLPMSYSYGLSVLHTHLLAGSVLLMTTSSFMQREYWDYIAQHLPTCLAGVPYHYETMLRMRMLEKELPGLRTLTQAGGRLDPERISRLEKMSSERGWRFFVMYGQTEATARISYVPNDRLREKVGSIGIAIPGGTLSLDDQTGELLYAGPNVMLGYAETRSDLAKGDELKGQLRTGDLAKRDEDGYHYIVGRLKRFLKVYGRRVSLDEIEGLIGHHGGGAVACFGADDQVRVAIEDSGSEQIVTNVLKDLLKIHPSAYRVVRLESLPRLPNSKIDYPFLTRLEGL
ncbi:MAG TPA: AMP-binding protein [Candidatus Acidoferrum sp.]|nr:AMP-binding protein [Candidatus Acidoferrum sp.]